jgi:hypothetical protein
VSSIDFGSLTDSSSIQLDGDKPKSCLDCPSPVDLELGLRVDVDEAIENSMRDEHLCFICLESITLGEDVAWSENLDCEHVFHKDCIVLWLQRSNDCPCCRQNFVPNIADFLSSSQNQESEDEELTHMDALKHQEAQYCVQHGLNITNERNPQVLSKNEVEELNPMNSTTHSIHNITEPTQSERPLVRNSHSFAFQIENNGDSKRKEVGVKRMRSM